MSQYNGIFVTLSGTISTYWLALVMQLFAIPSAIVIQLLSQSGVSKMLYFTNEIEKFVQYELNFGAKKFCALSAKWLTLANRYQINLQNLKQSRFI